MVVYLETSYNSNSSQSLSYNVSSQSSQGSPTSKKGKVNLNSEQELSDINEDETQEKEKLIQRERGGERCEEYTHTHVTYVCDDIKVRIIMINIYKQKIKHNK